MATKRHRGGRWHYTVRRAALLPKPLYLSFASEAEGDVYVARLEALLDQGVVPDGLLSSGAPKTIGAALREYQRAVAVKDADVLRVIERRWGDTPLNKLTYAWAELWIRSMTGLSPSRIRKFKGSLQRALTWVQAKYPETLGVNPLAQLPKGYSGGGSDERDRRLEPGEEEAILAVLTGDLRLIFQLALETAMRLREIYTLTWDQVDVDRRTIFLDRTKNGDKRQVPMSSVVVQLLQDGGEGPLFGYTGMPAQITTRLSKRFARAFEAAGVSGLRFHDIRHEATSRLYERTNLSDVEIAKITGHKRLDMLKRYANLRASSLADKLW